MPNGVPLSCKNDAGEVLGADGFVPGYTSLYVYDNVRNANPVVDGFHFDTGNRSSGSPGLRDDDGALQHIPRCAAGSTCKTYDIAVDLDKDKNQQIDGNSTDIRRSRSKCGSLSTRPAEASTTLSTRERRHPRLEHRRHRVLLPPPSPAPYDSGRWSTTTAAASRGSRASIIVD